MFVVYESISKQNEVNESVSDSIPKQVLDIRRYLLSYYGTK